MMIGLDNYCYLLKDRLFLIVKEHCCIEIRISRFEVSCGAEGIRTLDPLVANQVLSQLSYSPVADDHFAHQSGPEWS